jgi:heme exporter protein B
MRQAFFTLLQRDLRLAWLSRADAVTSLVFFLVVASLFPLAVGVEQKLLRDIGPGVVWVSALLASLLSLPRLFTADHVDGTLEQLLLTPQPLAVLALAKVLAHWLTTGLPLVLLAPLLGVQYGLASADIALLMVTLLLGTPTLSLLGAVGAALTLGLRGAAGLDATAQLSFLGALLAITLAGVPWAVAAALRVACE